MSLYSGLNVGRKAKWVGARGNQTFIVADELLVPDGTLSQYRAFANTHVIGEKSVCIHVHVHSTLRLVNYYDDNYCLRLSAYTYLLLSLMHYVKSPCAHTLNVV